jgi:VWFA-related protein
MRPFVDFLVSAVLCMAIVVAVEAHRQARPIPIQERPVFRAGIDLVLLDVSVLDRDREPVRGLLAEEFTVREDGKPQTVEYFEEKVLARAPARSAKWMTETSPDVVTNDFQNSRIWMIVLDDAMCLYDPFTIKKTKEIAHMVIDRLGDNDLAAVVFTRDNRNAQDFTSDHARLGAAVDKFTAGTVFASPRLPFGPGGAKGPYSDQYSFQSSVRTVKNAASYLASIPQSRKGMVYISVGLPINYDAMGNMAPGGGGDFEARELMVTLYRQMIMALEEAQRANVNVYTYDPAGLDGLSNYLETLRRSRRLPNILDMSPAPSAAYSEYLRTVAGATGGRAFVEMNEFEKGVEQMFRENGSYYLLGYRQTNPKPPGAYSRLDVTVNRVGLEVRTRHLNYTPVSEETGAEKKGLPPAPELKSLAGVLPDRSAPLRATVAAFATPGASGATLAIAIGLREPAPKVRVTEHLNLLTKAFTAEGDPRGSQSQVAEITINPGAGDVRYEVLSRMTLPKPGRYQLRLAANNDMQQKSGSVFIDVVVPDFANLPLSLSGIVLDSASPSGLVRRDAVRTFLPVVPTTEREFAVTAQVSAFLRVYQGGKKPLAATTLKVTITDDHDTVVSTTSATLLATRFGVDRSADFQYNIPTTVLKSGPHLLTFEVTMGANTARRDVVFAVK